MLETIGTGVLVGLALYGAFTLLERFYRAVTTQKQANTSQEQASFVLKLRELPASKQAVSEMIDARLAERLAEKDIDVAPAMRREIRRDVVDELTREDVLR